MSLVDTSNRTIGQFTVGPYAFGCWRFTDGDVDTARGVLETALDLGMDLIDTADVYGLDWGGTAFGQVEEIMGNVLTATPGLRDRMVLATKGGIMPPLPYDSSDAYIRSAVEASLRRLQTDVIDLYQIHRPDMFTHPAALAETLDSLVAEGKIHEIGVSNFTIDQTDALRHHLDAALVTDQPQFSPAHLDPMRDGTFDRAMQYGMVPLAWSPLAGGRLATGVDVPSALIEVLDELAEREGVSRAAICVAFILSHPAKVIPLLGSQNPDRLADMMTASNVTLDRNDVYNIVEASEGQPLP